MIVYGKKSSIWLDYIELSIRINQFEIFVKSLIHEKNTINCILYKKIVLR